MKFERLASTKFFTPQPTPQGEKIDGVCLYAPFADSVKVVDLAGELSKPTSFFLIIFFKVGTAITSANLDEKLDAVVQAKARRIYWLVEFTQAEIDGAPTITFDANNRNPVFASILLGRKTTEYFLQVSNVANRGQVSFSGTEFRIEADRRNYIFDAHMSEGGGVASDAFFSRLTIPAAGARQGSINFDSEGTKGGRLVQPISPYVGHADERYAVEYFDAKAFTDNVDLSVSLFPYEMKSNTPDGYVSSISMKMKGGKEVNFLTTTDKGQNFFVKDFAASFRAELAFVDFDSGLPRQYYFIPVGKLALKARGDAGAGAKMLCGYSGTQMIPAPAEVEFVRSPEIKVNEKKDGLETSRESCTSVPLFSKETPFFVDAEKSPAYSNVPADSKLQRSPDGKKVIGVETPYAPIPAGKLKAESRVPIIPTLKFKDDPKLFELEEVFSKLRLKSNVMRRPGARDGGGGPRVTPQGFLKRGSNIDFIHNQKPGARAAAGAPPDRSYHRFRLEGVEGDGDFKLGLTKEDVFFVTTPRLLKEAASAVNFNVFFGINGFNIDLLVNQPARDTPRNDEKIVIFKFSRACFKELLSDTSRWSNQGKYGNTDDQQRRLQEIADEINRQVRTFKTPDYDYFNKVIFEDPNWNGVVVLNVPLGDPSNLPDVIQGLANSQTLKPGEQSGEVPQLNLQTTLKFQFVAFPVNKTNIKDDGSIGITSTSFYGLIDYDLLKDRDTNPDYKAVSNHFPDRPPANTRDARSYRFLLTKLLVRFDNSNITNFSSFAFLQAPKLFEDVVSIDRSFLTHSKPQGSDTTADRKYELLRLEGRYQKNSNNEDEFIFNVETKIDVKLPDNDILEKITVTRASFSYVKGGKKEYRFDLDGQAAFAPTVDGFKELLSFDKSGQDSGIEFRNIGLKFEFGRWSGIAFDFSKLLVLPKISFDGKGFLKSFPLKFNRFQTFHIEPCNTEEGFKKQNFGFFNIHSLMGGCPPGGAMLWGLVFDLDLGTLGDLALLKALKAEILVGWTAGGGFKLGVKFAAPSSDGLHVDLFGALKLDIEEVKLCSNENDLYLLRLKKIRLTVMGVELPDPEEFDLSGIIFAQPGNKIAWFIAATKKNSTEPDKDDLVLGVGQRVGLSKDQYQGITKVEEGIAKVKQVFEKNLDPCTKKGPVFDFYKTENNWLLASERILPKEWAKVVDLKFIFNDPTLYGVHLGFNSKALKGLGVDIIYKKLSDSLGVWSLEIQIPSQFRNIEMGGASVTLPNIGVEIYTDGGWKVDVGFPRGADFSRSCLIQVRPFVGWAGIYLMKARSASLTLFKSVFTDQASSGLVILQAGFALRIGLGAYIDKGIFFAGASISVYGILEGAFAFEKGDEGLGQFFPNHFALMGRVGAIAEMVGYVDFTIVKVSVYLILRVEVGVLLIYLDRDVTGPDNVRRKAGLQPVTLYIEGSVRVKVEVTIACIKIFRRRFCIKVHYSFEASVRFQYTLGRDSGSSSSLMLNPGPKLIGARAKTAHRIDVGSVKNVPMTYVPGVTKTSEGGVQFVHSFAIPFFGRKVGAAGKVEFTDKNLIQMLLRGIFSDLLANLPPGVEPTYESLRSILLTGEVTSAANPDRTYEVELRFPEYRPWFIIGHSLTDARDAIFKKAFNFDKDDAEEVVKWDGTPEKNPFRVLPAPILPNIKYSVGDLSQPKDLPARESGFKIKVSNLVKDDKGDEIVCDVQELFYSEQQLAAIEKFFDEYKTQFLERQEQRLKAAADVPLRERFVVSEYFKLVTLLALEAYYNAGSAKQKGLKDELSADPSYNPVIAAGTVTGEDAEIAWKFNDNLEALIGQVNYFYNSGLRLPDFKTAMSTLAYYSLLKQATPIVGSSSAAGDVSVVFTDGATEVPLTKELFRRDDRDEVDPALVKAFKDDVDAHGQVALTELAKSFTVEEIQPYELLDVKLAVPNSQLRVKTVAGAEPVRFFALPEKMQKGENFYRVALNFAERKNEEGQTSRETARAAVCANVEVRARAHGLNEKNVRTLELSNVSIEDQALMNLLRGAGGIKGVSLYHRADGVLTNIGSPSTTIIKTNLSTETHPPHIGRGRVAKKPLTFIADLAAPADFTRLLWEGLLTNNGGYYIILDKEYEFADADPKKPGQEFTLVVSYELAGPAADVTQRFPSFCNYLRVTDGAGSPMFTCLDSNDRYLYLDLFTSPDDQSPPEPVREYHARIPAHCFGFKLSRPKELTPSTAAAHSKYLPVEFDLNEVKGAGLDPILTRDKVLPLMPSERDKKNPSETDDKFYYRHVTPLRADAAGNDPHNLRRYETVGKQFKLAFGLRDTFGFRAADLTKTLTHEHLYFDKLVPVESWPLLKFSYWLDSFSESSGRKGRGKRGRRASTPRFTWSLNAAIDLDGLLPLVGLTKSAMSRGRLTRAAARSAAGDIRNILRSLYTVLAQLTDPNVTAEVEGYEASSPVKPFLVERVKDTIAAVTALAEGELPPLTPAVKSLKLARDYGDFKTELGIRITIARRGSFVSGKSRYSEVNATNVWEYESVKAVACEVKLENPKADAANPKEKEVSTLKQLGDLMSDKSGGKYSLGASSNREREKVIYVIDQQPLGLVKPSAALDPRENYYGIKPFSNSLWSGSYELNGAQSLFSNVDLDEALRAVLAKVDDLLSPARLRENLADKEALDTLVGAKQKLVANDLVKRLEGVALLNGSVRPPTAFMKAQFQNLLLEKLGNFYDYDGVAAAQIGRDSKLDAVLANHRVTVTFDKQEKYNVVSSKISRSKGSEQGEWTIMFDQLTNDAAISLDLVPQITHVEFDIEPDASNPNLETSTWIQLLSPVKLAPVKTTGWPRIIRSFPPRPVITTHHAEQLVADAGGVAWSRDLGQWNYVLGITDRYELTDQVEILVRTLSATPKARAAAARTREGFVAFWAARIAAGEPDFKWKEFVNDLDAQFGSAPRAARDPEAPETPKRIVYVKQANGTWRQLTVEGLPPASVTGRVVNGELRIAIEGLNIFTASSVIAVKPEVRVLRNKLVENPAFQYQTDFVTTAGWATPRINYFKQLRKAAPMQGVIEDVRRSDLPYKMTAKYVLTGAGAPDAPLLLLPVQQMEFDAKIVPVDSVDSLFANKFANGKPALSLTIYNKPAVGGELPIFHAELIVQD